MQIEIKSPPPGQQRVTAPIFTREQNTNPTILTEDGKPETPDRFEDAHAQYTKRQTIQIINLAEKSTPVSRLHPKSRVTDSYEYREKTLISRLLYNATEIGQPPT